MRELSKQTRFVGHADAVKSRKWVVVDASGQPLGRLASRIAHVLRGKHKSNYQPNIATGDHVIVLNAEKVKLTGRKIGEKIAFRHSFYPGGARYVPYATLMVEKPEKAIQYAVKGMLPKTPLGRFMRNMLYIYKGEKHPHGPQKPEAFPKVLAHLKG